MQKEKCAYVNARLIDPESNFDMQGSLLTEGEHIVDFGTSLFRSGVPDSISKVIDCRGMALIPGIVDIHTHLREPGQEHKETIKTGTKAAAAGGVTTIACQPNTYPPVDNLGTLSILQEKARLHSCVNLRTYAAITKGLKGEELTDMHSLKEAGVIGFSDDGMPVSNPAVMRFALSYGSMLDVPIAQHAEDHALTAGGCINEGHVSEKLGVVGIPNSSEAAIVARDIMLCKETDSYYHALHLSTKEALAAVAQAKEQGLNVTCEVTPHHFILNEEEVLKSGTLAKMNPPLRSEEDRKALIEGLRTGIIDCIASDHAPHEPSAKNLPLSQAAFGIVGLETLLPLSLKLYHEGIMPLRDVLTKLTYKPADIIKERAGRIKRNYRADLALVDLDREWTINTAKFASKSKNSPFDGYKVRGKVLRTVVRGKTVYEDCDA
ncbi:dihydroorotase [Rickettsiales bacterium]|nr:dihydroorotase [Rickettsiales bacterium]